jgi:hypothetical protein
LAVRLAGIVVVGLAVDCHFGVGLPVQNDLHEESLHGYRHGYRHGYLNL